MFICREQQNRTESVCAIISWLNSTTTDLEEWKERCRSVEKQLMEKAQQNTELRMELAETKLRMAKLIDNLPLTTTGLTRSC
jgi:septal ring factor EnvC (AmiA/AmiB activator)